MVYLEYVQWTYERLLGGIFGRYMFSPFGIGNILTLLCFYWLIEVLNFLVVISGEHWSLFRSLLFIHLFNIWYHVHLNILVSFADLTSFS